MKDGKFTIHVSVGGFRIPLHIAREDEELYRRAEKEVNALLGKYQKMYVRRSSEEILSLVSYQLALARHKAEFASDTTSLINRLEQMSGAIDRLLSD